MRNLNLRFPFVAVLLCRLAAVVLLMALFVPQIRSDPDWDTLRSRAIVEASRGSLTAAEGLLQSALAVSSPASVQTVSTLCQLGAVHHEMGLLDKAQADSERALSIDATLEHPDRVQEAIALNNLAMVAGELHDHAKGEQLLEEAEKRLKESGRTDASTEALIKSNLAFSLQQMRRYREAETLYANASAQVRSIFGPHSTEYARLLANEALFDLERADIENSIRHGGEALTVERALPYMNPWVYAGTLSNLGLALTQRGQFAEAEGLLGEAIRREKASGDQHKDQLVASLTNLASLQEKQRRLEEAKQTIAEISRLTAAQNNNISDRTRAAVASNAGRIALDEGRYNEAKRYLNEACALSEKSTGTGDVQYAGTLSNLAALESAQKNHKKAETLYRKAWEIDEAVLGANHPEVASDMSNTATQMFYLNHRREALDLYERAKVIMETSYGPVSVPVAQTWENIAVVQFSDKEFTNAVKAYSNAVNALTQATAGQDRRLPSWLHAYALALRKTGEAAQAEAVETRAVGLEVRTAVAADKQRAPAQATALHSGKT